MKWTNPLLLCYLSLVHVDAWSTSSCASICSFTRPTSRLYDPVPEKNVKCRTSAVTMGMQVKIRIVGRKKSGAGDRWLEEAYGMYDTRLRPSGLEVETIWHKNDDELVKNVRTDQSKQHTVVLLDPQGKMCTSEEFSNKLYDWLDQGGSRVAFVIGGAEGLPNELRESSIPKLSLSKLTFTHQFARLTLAEQIYRASEIRKGSGYHK